MTARWASDETRDVSRRRLIHREKKSVTFSDFCGEYDVGIEERGADVWPRTKMGEWRECAGTFNRNIHGVWAAFQLVSSDSA
jgi:hypothetical protein